MPLEPQSSGIILTLKLLFYTPVLLIKVPTLSFSLQNTSGPTIVSDSFFGMDQA